ncbi:hypothetical protein A3C09_04950 [Candidatus Uhrbacteria bacterium RIFCSPHIGHO2_02_FULL_47_44]|uniref:Uncharacterized protein n=1 Tax=Candidatus Uhrbacteria bacterium RIFCSPLOWO2_02_FULL_48_18 TaxID=1802408 RepID=A0A1F7V9Y4_9BACT|nr:MAG: hypothetical protein A2839_04675 [Candidatus Uhrbacteria bacterium RIFCSPHIGHO2_01_FULL_47_10]OGL70708.1 MAG: hypothetical protein A3C09_04950 [Candidatus Uhrbacteria bacterium RIFCSPHIGHO2_02_FULL_47_44]OGL77785.1 MAG: hypothetical protein A3E97_00995 [Candidatus Uhrbacteria bacterium RIFCSPHIGHO2_12_FULL_47_12]OGL82283.1 MAG: hypothetical protein A3B20_00835 [Candidatus Uhrbacteria bacterium RIFCSPLOWO2_01_FULL_47_17]OGL86774.1 MAG: hypothetical protein A3I41_05555 [Candidatus Uhrbact
MTIVLTWAMFKWAIIPLVIFFFIGLTGVLPDNPFGPIRAATALFSGICILIWIIVMIGRSFFL